MRKRKIILVALAPFYEGTVLWVEQLFDFLNIFTRGTIFLPQVKLNEKVVLEDNVVLSLLARQYENTDYYKANANIGDVEAYMQARAAAFVTIKSYFTFAEDRIMLEQFNDRLYWALARQYEMLLPETLQPTFLALQQELLTDLTAKLEVATKDAVVVVPIEHAAIFQEYLEAMFEQQIFLYGEDYLDTGKI